MGETLAQAKATAVVLDGVFRVVPGYDGLATDAANNYRLDEFPWQYTHYFNSDAGTQGWHIPFNATIIKVHAGSGLATEEPPRLLNIGTATDTDKFVDDYALATTLGVAQVDLTTASNVVATAVTAGEILLFTAAAGSACKTSMSVFLIPRL